jgi:hypothetical protein
MGDGEAMVMEFCSEEERLGLPLNFLGQVGAHS